MLLDSPESPDFVGGDFNLRHPAWDSYSSNNSTEAAALLDWAREKDLCLLNPTDVPTHNRGGTLDLAFSTLVGAKCEIAPELHTTSDHETLVSTIPLQGDLNKCTMERLRYGSINEDLFKAFLGECQDLPTIRTAADIETEAEYITQTIHTALQVACPRTKGTFRRSTWWNEECRTASLNWHNTAPLFQTPPLKGADGIADVQCPEQKAALLHRVLLSRQTEASDIPPDTPTVAIRSIPWEPFIEEVFRATCQVTSSSPGIYKITTPILRLAWPIIGRRISNLFNKCAELGSHPYVFKDAEVIILSKSGKRDRTAPKSYRPISLFSCLGKGLERLIARRLSYWALKFDVLARDQCSAVSRCSATDLTTALLCDIKDALAARNVAGMVTVNVKSALDVVLRNRLLNRLRSQGWPVNITRWVNSFLLDRTAKNRLDQTTSEKFPIICGLPQGSPTSLILFLLYVEPVLRISRSCCGYADDITTLEIARNLEERGRKLQTSLDQTLQWGLENGVQFESAKTVVQYFHQKRSTRNPRYRWKALSLHRMATHVG
ncbi:hypothetical protein K3495_g12807 [Podosphaera aphanis]|nr:hypothetical protein K3495_g12807 [Podosphaera aphanis]